MTELIVFVAALLAGATVLHRMEREERRREQAIARIRARTGKLIHRYRGYL